MVTYDSAGFRAAFELYLQNPNLYPEPNWANYVIATPTTPTPSGGSNAIPAPHVDAVSTGSDQLIPPLVQNPNADKNQTKIKEQTLSDNSKVTFIPQNKFGGEAGTYGNPIETVVPAAKVETGINTKIVSPIEPVENIGQTVVPKPIIQSSLITPTIPKLVSNQPSTPTPIENKVQTQKVPLTSDQVDKIHTYVDQVSKAFQDAKASGAKTIVATVNGNVIDRFVVNDNTKEELFAAIPNLQKNYGNVQLSFTGASTKEATTQKVPLTSDQVDQIHTYAESVVQTVKEAKASGATNIIIKNDKGEKIDSVPVNDETTRVLFLAVPALQQNNKGLSLSYTPPAKNVLPANYTPSYEEDIKTYGKEQVNPFTEIIKGSNEGLQDIFNTGKSIATYVWSGGKVAVPPVTKGDILSNTLTSPIKTTVDSSGKTTTTITAENAKENLSNVLSDIQKKPCKTSRTIITFY